jgi:hypothetical protein
MAAAETAAAAAVVVYAQTKKSGNGSGIGEVLPEKVIEAAREAAVGVQEHHQVPGGMARAGCHGGTAARARPVERTAPQARGKAREQGVRGGDGLYIRGAGLDDDNLESSQVRGRPNELQEDLL